MKTMNKKGIIGSGLATIWAILIMAIILAIFLMFTGIFNLLKFGSDDTPIDDKIVEVEQSLEVIALLKTPIKIEVDGIQEELPLSDILTLYGMGKVPEDVVNNKVNETLNKFFGNGIHFKFQYGKQGDQILSGRWGHPFVGLDPPPHTNIYLPSGRFSMINRFHYCVLEHDIETCNTLLNVK